MNLSLLTLAALLAPPLAAGRRAATPRASTTTRRTARPATWRGRRRGAHPPVQDPGPVEEVLRRRQARQGRRGLRAQVRDARAAPRHQDLPHQPRLRFPPARNLRRLIHPRHGANHGTIPHCPDARRSSPPGPLGPGDLKKQIEDLKKQVAALEERPRTRREARTGEDPHQGGNQGRPGQHRLGRRPADPVRHHQWHFKPYQQFMGFVQNTTPAPSNPYPFMPMAQQMPAQDLTNSVEWSTRLRLNMTITINENAKIMGRLTMYKIHGGADVPIFNGAPNTVSNSFNAGQDPRQRRAAGGAGQPRLRLQVGGHPLHRPPEHLRRPALGSPRRHRAPGHAPGPGGERQVDGIGWKFHLDKLGFPEHTLLGLCYGVGYESGFGGGGPSSSSAVVGMNFTNASMANPSTPPCRWDHRPPQGHHRPGRHAATCPCSSRSAAPSRAPTSTWATTASAT